jgi:hypothetical protein
MLAGSSTTFGNSGLATQVAALYGAPTWAMCLERSPPSGWHIEQASFTPIGVPNPNGGCATLANVQTGVTVLITSFNNNLSPPPATANPLSYQVPVALSIDNTTTPQGPIIITNGTTVTNANATAEPISVLQACLMTSAFPMLLPSVPYDLQFGHNNSDQGTVNYFLDGGIYAGSPALAAYLYALENGLDIDAFISIGCGAGGVTTGLAYSQVMEWGGQEWMNLTGTAPLMKLMMHEPAITVDALLGTLMPGKYFRLQPPLPAGDTAPPWSSDTTDLSNWVGAADSLVTTLNTLTGTNGKTLWQNMIDAIEAKSS